MDTQPADHLALNALLVTSPPKVSLADAQRIAETCFPGFQHCTPLTGERDVNFRLTHQDGRSLTLKFINQAEGAEETAMQIAVLKHLDTMRVIHAPRHQTFDASSWKNALFLSAEGGQADLCDVVHYQTLEHAESVRVRAYTYLEGCPGTQLQNTPATWYALGQTIAILDTHLSSFDHPAAHRPLLWDTCQVLGIRPMLSAVKDPDEQHVVAEFLQLFEHITLPVLPTLPHQIIHNDLSPSNVLTDAQGVTPTGILDFGDMVYSPRIGELAVAASYQMGLSTYPEDVLSTLLQGFEAYSPLSHTEREHVIDLVLARLVQRIVITSWRASRFPANRTYILRSHDAAKALFMPLYTQWRSSKAKQLPSLTSCMPR